MLRDPAPRCRSRHAPICQSLRCVAIPGILLLLSACMRCSLIVASVLCVCGNVSWLFRPVVDHLRLSAGIALDQSLTITCPPAFEANACQCSVEQDAARHVEEQDPACRARHHGPERPRRLHGSNPSTGHPLPI